MAKEDGIGDFKVFRHSDEPLWYLFYETYRDQEALDAHYKTSHLDAFAEVLEESIADGVIKGFWEEVASI